MPNLDIPHTREAGAGRLGVRGRPGLWRETSFHKTVEERREGDRVEEERGQ